MYEDYLTKALVGIINAKQALNNFEQTNIKDLKNIKQFHSCPLNLSFSKMLLVLMLT